MDNNETFLYTVNPRKVIVGLSGVKAIRSAKSLHLTKEDVLACLKKATVYRRFSNEGMNVRVTPSNVDRLHNAKFISEEEWAAAGNKAPAATEPVRGTVKEPEKEPEKAPEVATEPTPVPPVEEPSKNLQEEIPNEQNSNEVESEEKEVVAEEVVSDDDDVIEVDDSVVEEAEATEE